MRACLSSIWIVALVAAACGREPVPAPSMEDVRAEVAPTQESWDVRYSVTESPSGSESSRPRLSIEARYMATYETSDSTYTTMESDSSGRIMVHLFDEVGDTSATVRANRLVLYDDQNRFEARGDVSVRTPDDKTLLSEHLVWYEADRKVRTPGFVRIRTPKERIQGYELEADENLATYTLRRVTGQVTVEDEE